MKPMRYLILGSNSFSGGWMVETILARDPHAHVIGVSRSPEKSALHLPYRARRCPSFVFHQLDVNRDTSALCALIDDVRPAYVINFAAQGEVGTSWTYPDQWFETNAVGVVKVAHHLRGKPFLTRYVHISTPEVYGSCVDATEDHPLDPSTPYAASKAAGDLFLLTLAKECQFPVTIVRSTNVYGIHQQLYRIIPRTVLYLHLGRTIELHGGGRAVKSYIHITDVCDGIWRVLRHGGAPGTIYHFAPREHQAIHEVVERICVLMGVDVSRAVRATAERPGQDAAYILDTAKARAELGWNARIPFAVGLRDMVSWLRTHAEELSREPLAYAHQV